MQRFNRRNQKTRPAGQATVRLYPDGKIALNVELVRLLGISEGDTLEFIRTDAADWYLMRGNSDTGLPARKGSGGQLAVYHSIMVKTLMGDLGIAEGVTIPVAKLPTELPGNGAGEGYAILTAAVRNGKKITKRQPYSAAAEDCLI